jgi:4-amino-4-deoxy-L-arabinose transferase-like glycosyltransferase
MDSGGDQPLRYSTAKQVAILLLVAIALRLSLAWWLDHQLQGRFAFGDSESYWALARCIAHGEPFQFGSADARIFRTPGYPSILATVFLLAGDEPSPMWGRALGAGLGALAVLGVWWLAGRLFGPRAGLLAGAVAACYPGAVVTSLLVLSEAPFSPFMLAQLGLWIEAWRSPSRRRAGLLAFAAGLAAGAATLMRPSWLLFTPFALLIGVLAPRQRPRHLGLGLVMVIGLCVAMAPWWIRNAQITGHFVPTTLQLGASLYDGLNPAANGASNMEFVPGFNESRAKRFSAGEGAGETFEYYLDRQYRDAAVAWACSHPGRAVQLAGIKFCRLWNVWPNEPRFSGWPVRLAMLGTYVPVMLLALLGIARTIRCGWPYVLCWLPAVYLTVLHVIFVSSIRYREPAMLALIVLAAGAALGMKEQVSGNNSALPA